MHCLVFEEICIVALFRLGCTEEIYIDTMFGNALRNKERDIVALLQFQCTL